MSSNVISAASISDEISAISRANSTASMIDLRLRCTYTSYIIERGPGRDRTCDLEVMSPLLYH